MKIRSGTSEDVFQQAMTITLKSEGGWYDGSGAHDPNPTMYGVTQRTYDSYRGRKGLALTSVQHIQDNELRDIYRSYWTGAADAIAPLYPHAAALLFDHAINAGPPAAIKVLQSALNSLLSNPLLVVDGVMGPNTREVLDFFQKSRDYDISDLDYLFANQIILERMAHYLRIVRANRKKVPALPAWIGRLVDFRTKYLLP